LQSLPDGQSSYEKRNTPRANKSVEIGFRGVFERVDSLGV
jgi:hypothetical protein